MDDVLLPPADAATALRFDAHLGALDGWLGGFPPVAAGLADETVPWWRVGWSPEAERSEWRGITAWLRWRGIAGLDDNGRAFAILPKDTSLSLYWLIENVINGVAAHMPLPARVGSGGARRPRAELLEHYHVWLTQGEPVGSVGDHPVSCPRCGTHDEVLITPAMQFVCTIEAEQYRWAIDTLSAYDILPLLHCQPPRL